MTCYGAKELAAAFRTVRKNTIQIAEEIPEDKYGFRPAPGSRSVAETLVHIALSPRMQKQIQFTDRATTLAGFNFLGLRDQLEGKLVSHARKLRLSLCCGARARISLRCWRALRKRFWARASRLRRA